MFSYEWKDTEWNAALQICSKGTKTPHPSKSKSNNEGKWWGEFNLCQRWGPDGVEANSDIVWIFHIKGRNVF